MLEPIMRNLFCFGLVLACLGLSAPAPAFAQTYDDSTAPVVDANCRAVAGQAEIDGTMQQIVGRACLQSDGTWQIMHNPDGSVLTYPIAQYPYPDPWYWGPPVFIGAGVSFIFVDRFHHFSHFHHFHQMEHVHVGGSMRGGFHGGHTPVPSGGMHMNGGMRRH